MKDEERPRRSHRLKRLRRCMEKLVKCTSISKVYTSVNFLVLISMPWLCEMLTLLAEDGGFFGFFFEEETPLLATEIVMLINL